MDAEIRSLIENSFTGGASDVFLTEGERPRVRANGEIIIAHGGPVSREAIAGIWRECGLDPAATTDGDASLSVENAGDFRRVVDGHGRQLWFRTVDQALEELANIPYLSEEFSIDRTDW